MTQIFQVIITMILALAITSCAPVEDDIFATARITVATGEDLMITRVQAQTKLTNVNTRQVLSSADFEGNGITVNGNLAIYGQAGRQGYIGINATDAAVYATGDVTVSNLYFDYDPYSTYCILSGGDILIAGGDFKSWSNLRANAGNGTIT